MRVFDRFTVVLHIFRCNARTKEARLQVALAELPLLRYLQSLGSGQTEPSSDPLLLSRTWTVDRVARVECGQWGRVQAAQLPGHVAHEERHPARGPPSPPVKATQQGGPPRASSFCPDAHPDRKSVV